MMSKKLRPSSEFNRNILTLMTGTTIAQAIPIAISPILTRIYTPDDFGIFALFMSITLVLGSIASGRYELAIMLPRKDEDAINIVALGSIITFIVTLILIVFVVAFNDYFTQLLNSEEISLWLYFIPLSVCFMGLYNLLFYFNNRKKNYKDISNARILKSIVLAMVQLLIGFISTGASGLVSGQISSQLFANFKLFNNIIKEKKLVSKINKIRIIALSKKHKDFPKFSMWAALANTSSQQLTNILISTTFSVTTLGYYYFVQRTLGMPSSLIGEAIGNVFFQNAVEEKQQTGTSINSFKYTLKKVLMIGIPSFIFIFFIIEDLFAFVFSESWRIAGEYARILTPFFLVRFIVSPLTRINQVYLKNRNVMFWQFGLLLLSIIILQVSTVNALAFKDFLYLFSSILSAYYLYHLYLLYIYIKNDKK